MLERSCPCWLSVGLLVLVGCGGSSTKTEPQPQDETSWALEFQEIELAGGVEALTDFAFLPSGDELVVLGKEGALHHFALDGSETELLGSAALTNVYPFDDCGALSLALDPDFENNQFVFIGQCSSVQESGVFRYRFDPPNYDDFSDTEVSIVEVGHPDADRPWHNVGALNFDEEGYLWVPFGDKVQGDPAQDPSNPLGSLLRIEPNRAQAGSGHEPAPDNPFVGDDDLDPDVYAYGLRSPWRGTFDSQGRYWFGDVGSDQY
jgi:glucose/arabinose dehydrogenase